MAYCTTKTMPRTRGKAMKMLILEKETVQTVADQFGVNRTTIWRWKKKWQTQNQHLALTNAVRHKDAPTSQFRWSACKWNIPTQPATPLHPHRLSNDIVRTTGIRR